MEFDVVIVGGGPAGLSAACRLKQLANESGGDINVCLIEKGSEIGAHIISGAVLEARVLTELFPNWQSLDAPLRVPVTKDEFYLFRNEHSSLKWPGLLLPRSMDNKGNYVISLSNFCRWLGEQAASLGIEIFPGFAAQQVIIEDNIVKGIITGDQGVDRNGEPKGNRYIPGMELRAKYTLFAEGSRGHLGKKLSEDFQLAQGVDPQHYAIGLKEIWEIDPEKHQPGLVIHGAGWPLDDQNPGGSFLYHFENNLVAVGLIVDLNYRNPHLSPFNEFQRLKDHPQIQKYLNGGKRVSYGARAISKGGYHSLPKMIFPGGALIGCDLGTLNFSKIKGIHTAMKSGMLAAEAINDHIGQDVDINNVLTSYPERFKASWLFDELFASRNFGPAIHRFGLLAGGAMNFIEQNLFAGKLAINIHDRQADHAQLKNANLSKNINYEKPNGKNTFDRVSSVFLTNLIHEDDQPVHLKLADADIPISKNLASYDEPAQRYCPAAVYEIIEGEKGKAFQINAQNCIHCKVCDIKDPAQNITWTPPEGGSGPNYSNM